MSEQNTRRMLLENLYQLTKLALRQAKIEYVEALNSTLAERETVLATMWGYDPQQGLPEIAPDSKLVKKPEPNAEDNELFEEIRDLDRQLVSVLKHNMNKLNDEKLRLNNGQKYMNDVRDVYKSISKSRYLDHVG